jgi:hypothetical protein
MESFIPLAILFGAAFFFAKLRRWVSRNDNYLEILKTRYPALEIRRSLSSRLGYRRPNLKFDYGRTYCRLSQSRRTFSRRTRFTELSLRWPDPDFFLHVSTTPQTIYFLGRPSPDLVLENAPSFNLAFHSCSNKQDFAARVLSSQVQWKLEQLKKLCDESNLSFSIRGGLIKIRRTGWFVNGNDLEEFIQLSLEIFDQMMLVNAEGMEFLHEGEAAVVHDVKCPICTDEITHEMVMCQRCKTPHCLDCWDYNGKCATFACNETRYQRVNSQVVES